MHVERQRASGRILRLLWASSDISLKIASAVVPRMGECNSIEYEAAHHKGNR